MDGYLLNTSSNLCEEERCDCENGIGKIGNSTECLSFVFSFVTFSFENTTVSCESCDEGYSLSASTDPQTCEFNTCTCNNGSPTNGTNCPDPSVETCASCDPGFDLVNSLCTPKICNCNNGTGKSSGNCLDDTVENDCESCNSPYLLHAISNDQGQTFNECLICPNGQQVTFVNPQFSDGATPFKCTPFTSICGGNTYDSEASFVNDGIVSSDGSNLASPSAPGTILLNLENPNIGSKIDSVRLYTSGIPFDSGLQVNLGDSSVDINLCSLTSTGDNSEPYIYDCSNLSHDFTIDNLIEINHNEDRQVVVREIIACQNS